MSKNKFFVLTLLLAIFLASCLPQAATPTTPPIMTEEPGIPVTGVALVQSVSIQILETEPLQVNAIVRGQLPDAGCTTISSVNQVREGNTFRITLSATTDPVALCALAITPFERVIPLDVDNLAAAKYIVNVNGVEAGFELLPREASHFKQMLVEALHVRNYELLKLMMADSFMIGYWLSEGTTNTPDAAIEQLRVNLLNSSSPITADYARNLVELLGTDPIKIVGPDVIEASPLFVSGLGAQGQDEAILFTAKQPDGSLYWYGLLFAKDGFARPTPTAPPVDMNAYPTGVKFVMAQKDVRMRSGPGTQFSVITIIAAGQTVKVTGVSANGYWWRVICPDNSIGSCWVSADASLTKPTDGPLPDTTAYPTNVQYVMAQRDVTMYSGPSDRFNSVGHIAAGQIAKVTGVSANGWWWRVICPDSSIGSCWVSADPGYTRPTDLTGNADVQSVEIQISESYPLQVNAIARGYLPDAGCTTIAEISQSRSGNVFTVEITTKFDPQAFCAQILTPFEQVIALEVGSLLPGAYLVKVNSVEASFQLPEPVLPTDVTYVMAQQDISIYSGPSTQASLIGSVAGGQIAKVTGVSADGKWWRVLCPDNSVGSCWVLADPSFTRPTGHPGNADVQSLEIQVLESYPRQVNAIVRGQLPDAGCTTIASVRQVRNGNTIQLTLTTVTEPQALCAQMITTFEQVIPLDVSSLLPARYIVKANGVEASFQLPEPTLPPNAQ
jgi:uncharacterized protein YraI